MENHRCQLSDKSTSTILFLFLIKRKILFFQDRYDPVFQARVDSCPVITVSDLAQLKSDMNCAQLRYSNEKEFTTIANTLRIMSDFKVRFNQFVFEYKYK